MKKLITGIHHVNIPTAGKEKFEETVRFYSEILGMELLRSGEKDGKYSAMIDTGAGAIEINSSGTGTEPTGILNHVALATDDVDGAVSLVRKAGYEITTEPRNGALGGVIPIRIAFCTGPNGERIEFFCEGK